MEIKTESNHFEIALQKIEDLTRENYRLRRENYKLQEKIQTLNNPQPKSIPTEDSDLINKVNEIFAEADAAMNKMGRKNNKEAKKYAKQK